MAKFDLRSQKVVNQINAEAVDVINFSAVQNSQVTMLNRGALINLSE